MAYVDNRALLKMMKSIEESLCDEIEPYQDMPIGRLREVSVGFVPPRIIAPQRNEESMGYSPRVEPDLDAIEWPIGGSAVWYPPSKPPQGGSVIAPPDGRVSMQEAADALATMLSTQETEPYTPQPDYDTDALFADAEWKV